MGTSSILSPFPTRPPGGPLGKGGNTRRSSVDLHKSVPKRDNRGPPPRTDRGPVAERSCGRMREGSTMMRAAVRVLALVVWLAPAYVPARGQFIERERDVSVTGPGGRTIER